MIRNQITYQLGAILCMIGFALAYMTARKKYFLVYDTYISKTTIYLFQVSTIIIILFSINMFLDINNLLPYSLQQNLPLFHLWILLFGISLWTYGCEKILREIVKHLASLPIEERDNREYTTILERLKGVKKARRLLYIPVVLFAIMTYIIVQRQL